MNKERKEKHLSCIIKVRNVSEITTRLRFGDLNSTFTLKVACPTEGTKVLVQSLRETGPKSLSWASISVPGLGMHNNLFPF